MGYIQTAYYVPDLEAAAVRWATHLGAGPFYTAKHIPLSKVVYQDQSASLDHSSAYGWYGSHMVELVECHTQGPSVFADRAYGLHHMARIANDFDAELDHLAKNMGWPTACVATTNSDMRFAFVDANVELGHYIELYEDLSSIHDFYRFIEAEAKNWNGENPVRTL